MRILFVTAEVAPYAKVGGLADVAGSLPKALQALGHEVLIVMPAYGHVIHDKRWRVQSVSDEFFVNVNENWFAKSKLYRTDATGFPVALVDHDDVFLRAQSSADVYTFHRDDYLFFAHAALEVARDLQFQPDIVHCHDWHTGFLPPIMREAKGEDWSDVASVLTIHNLAYQGEFQFDTLEAAGLRSELFTPEILEFYGGVNFLKSGAVYADQVNTVSENYMSEIQTPEFGCRLDGVMRYLSSQGRLTGILNGIDTEVHNPQTDPCLPANFSAEDLSGKAICRAELIKESGLDISANEPVAAMITRLSSQKGFDLLLAVEEELFKQGTALVVVGQGDEWASGELRRMEDEHPGKCKFFNVFDPDLAQRVYAGSDLFLMPSQFEPCGLGQMFSMRYGSVPVASATGGLADTVFEGQNGFIFERGNADAFASALARARQGFTDPDEWLKLIKSGMNSDFSWSASAQKYVQLYERAISGRQKQQAVNS
ncbi:glycogen synthase [Kamptonema cortianum]|nr:glycogen synthase [Geitlerinema splendidum]MDK3156210.1 glycogen synthase [Kamptonema cortianum]